MQHLVSSEWLNQQFGDKDLVVLYTTLIAKKAVIPKELEGRQIKGARFFDLQKVFSDQSSGLPNTYPSVIEFEEGCRALGITNKSNIVVYDSIGIYSSPRVWFLFKSIGYERVYVLNGGLQSWVKAGFPTENKKPYEGSRGNFTIKIKPLFLVALENIKKNLTTKESLIIDARSSVRFRGEVAEARDGLRSGNIPQSVNLHYADLLEDGAYKTEKEIRKLFSQTVLDEKPIIFSCGSGITACILYFAAHHLLPNQLNIYDGSWTEWGTVY